MEPGADSSAERPFFAAVQPQALAGLAQMAALELHTWGSRLPRPDRADRVTFDIDPDPDLPWQTVCAAAGSIREFLAELTSTRAETSGGFGLRRRPLQGRLPAFAAAAGFAKAVAHALRGANRAVYRAPRRGEPQGRMYIDNAQPAGRNDRRGLLAALAQRRAVSTPVAWSSSLSSIYAAPISA